MFCKFSLILIFIIAGAILFPCYIANASNSLLNPDVFVSSDNLSQADTLLVAVKNETKEITGSLGSVKLRFFRNDNDKDWVAITGMTIDKKPGRYKLSINVPGKAPFEKYITVSKQNFTVTALTVTPELYEKGYTVANIIAKTGEENKTLSKILNVITPKSYISKPFIYPLSEIKDVGSFGNIRKSKSYQIQHLGVDLSASLNTPVYSANDGKVVFVKSMQDYGNTIVVDHGLGVYSLYLHLNSFNVKKGQSVKQGDVLGLSGNTGYSIGPHLHFSIKVRGASLDPLKFINTTQSEW